MILDQILKRKMINHLHHVSLKHFKCVSISCKWHCEDELKVKVNESIVPFPFPFHCSFPKTLNVFSRPLLWRRSERRSLRRVEKQKARFASSIFATIDFLPKYLSSETLIETSPPSKGQIIWQNFFHPFVERTTT